MSFDWAPLFLSLRLAAVTIVLLVVIGIPFASWLSFTESRLKNILGTLVNLPLVLPPTVLGFYILLLFSPSCFLGKFLEQVFHLRIVFTFTGLVIGSVLFGLPFMINPVRAGLESFPKTLIEASLTLGKSRLETFFRVILPGIRPSLLSGIIMAFAHTLGEFGVVLMVGGSIPGETRTASIAIFSEVESLNYGAAHVYSAILLLVSFAALFTLTLMTQKKG